MKKKVEKGDGISMQRASVSKMCKNVWKTELSWCSKKPN